MPSLTMEGNVVIDCLFGGQDHSSHILSQLSQPAVVYFSDHFTIKHQQPILAILLQIYALFRVFLNIKGINRASVYQN